MKKFLCFNLFALALLAGCGSFPTSSEYWTINGKWPGYKIVQDDMMACGFSNTSNPVDMPEDDFVKAHLCMEKKGYVFNGKSICTKRCYKYHPACKAATKERTKR